MLSIVRLYKVVSEDNEKTFRVKTFEAIERNSMFFVWLHETDHGPVRVYLEEYSRSPQEAIQRRLDLCSERIGDYKSAIRILESKILQDVEISAEGGRS